MSLTRTTLIALLEVEVKGLSSYLDADDYGNAVDDAARETGWALPLSDAFKEYWYKTRSKRHLFYYLLSESAHKFKVKQINLQHRFDHYSLLVKDMDEKFAKVQEDYPELFTSADYECMFGSKIDAGFAYEPLTGRDITYDTDQKVIISPE